MARTRLEWAQWMAAKGITVFIVNKDSKTPLGGHSWMSRCTTDPQQIADWFEQDPGCNYGLWMGDDYAVVDLDKSDTKNGVRAFEGLCAENGIEWWQSDLGTFTVKTPSGGYHLYFKVDTPIANANNFPNGIDVRAAVGYVVGPGCSIVAEDYSEGFYDIMDPEAEIIECPEWIMAKMRPKNFKDPNRHNPHVEYDLPANIEQALDWLAGADVAEEGAEGDQRTYDVCCQMRDFGLSEEETLRVLNDESRGSSWNQRCDPPWSDQELEVKIRNSNRYAANRPGCDAISYKEERMMSGRPAGGHVIHAAQKADMFNPKSGVDQIVDNSLADRRKKRAVDAGIPEDVADDEAGKYNEPDQGPPKRLWWGIEDFAARENIREYVIKDWLIAHGVTALLATRGTGKSTVALDLAMHLAHDMDWWGTPTMKGWKVIYICGEDDEGMILNVRAWADYENRGLPPNDRFEVADDIIKLTSSSELELRMGEMVAWADGARCIIILDTWARATSGFSANTQEEMDVAYENAEKIAKALEGPMIACFHPPKEGKLTIRGSAVQEDASSGIWTLTDEGTTKRLRVARAKGKGHGNYRDFKFKKVDLEGKDFYGEPYQGIVAIKDGGTEDEGTQTHTEKVAAKKRAWAWMVVGCEEYPLLANKYKPLGKMNSSQISEFVRAMYADAERGMEEAETFVVKYLQPGLDLGFDKFYDNEKSIAAQLRTYFFSGPSKPVVFPEEWTVSVNDTLFEVERAPDVVI